MQASIWSEKILKVAEVTITRVVDGVLSRNFLASGRRATCVQEVLETLETPTREEADAMREQIDRLNQEVEKLAARLEERDAGAPRNPGGA